MKRGYTRPENNVDAKIFIVYKKVQTDTERKGNPLKLSAPFLRKKLDSMTGRTSTGQN